MAEIKIEKKNPIWTWISIALIVFLVILYFFVFKDSINSRLFYNTTGTTSIEMDKQSENDDAVTAYINFISGDANTMTIDHEYVHEALNKLANATKAISNETGVDVSADLSEVKKLSEKITANPIAITHADDIRKASIIIATAIGIIQQSKFADLSADCNQLMNDAKAVDENDLTLDQKSTLNTFYNTAADLLQKMNSK